jgi:hypothetical protein
MEFLLALPTSGWEPWRWYFSSSFFGRWSDQGRPRMGWGALSGGISWGHRIEYSFLWLLVLWESPFGLHHSAASSTPWTKRSISCLAWQDGQQLLVLLLDGEPLLVVDLVPIIVLGLVNEHSVLLVVVVALHWLLSLFTASYLYIDATLLVLRSSTKSYLEPPGQ